MRVVLEPGPADVLVLDEIDGELDVHRRFETGARDLPFALSLPYSQESEDRQSRILEASRIK